MTATPSLNKLQDIAGLLIQVWETSMLCMTKNASFLGCDSAYTIENITHTVGENGKWDVYSPFLDGTTPEQMQEVKKFCSDTGLKPWAIMPAFTKKLSPNI